MNQIAGRDSMRILLSEGSSTSAREAITILGEQGHHVEVCDPDPFCLGRFSRFVRRFHRCPGLGQDPEGYVDFVLDLVASRSFDVLLPIHEQGLALCKVADELARYTAVALPDFDAYYRVHSKVGFCEVLSALGLPQPRTMLIDNNSKVGELGDFPVVLKTSIGTASRGVWKVNNPDELRTALKNLQSTRPAEAILAQEWIDAPVEHAQAVFSHGRMVAVHAYRQLMRGAGGGDALKESVHRPIVGEHLSRLGSYLNWHGALSVDYLARPVEGPCYIDCNPRLVEPMNAAFAGADLLSLLLRTSCDHSVAPISVGRAGVRSHIAMQALLGCALQTGSRWAIVREGYRLLIKQDPYANSREEMTPLRKDWPSVLPTLVAAIWLLISPKAAETMPEKRWSSHLLDAKSIRTIREKIGSAPAGSTNTGISIAE